ncbi:hypothetical protein AB205_0037350, partial [Aquarana catesbeiana]
GKAGFTGQVVFHKMSPNETLFLESTNKIYKDDISNSSFVNFQIWDFPGQVDFFDSTFDYEMIFRGTGALIYVIDAQEMKGNLHKTMATVKSAQGSASSLLSPKLEKKFGYCLHSLHAECNGTAYDKESMAIIKLNNTTVLYLKEVTKFLSLVCILREESFERKGLIDYNFHCFRKAIHEVFEVGAATHRTFSHQASSPNLNAVTHNGTPANTV